MAADRSELLRSLSIDRASGTDAAPGRAPWRAIALGLAALLIVGVGGSWLMSRGGAGAPGENHAEAREAVEESAGRQADGAGSSPPPAERSAAAARSGSLVASGYVVARRRATVSAEITGRLLEVLVEEGDVVEEGQVLARMDSAIAEVDFALAEANARSAAANADAVAADLLEAEQALSRAERLVTQRITSVSNLDEARARVDGLRARLAAAHADAEAAEFSAQRQQELVDRHLVRAPFSGVIIDKNAQPGEIVSPTSAGGGFTRTGVYTLVDMDSLEIEVDVNEGQIERVAAGQRVEAVLDAYPRWRIAAHVAAIIPTANRDRATIQVRVAFDDLDPRILPDMAARVTFLEAE